jgi:hypothetical protein
MADGSSIVNLTASGLPTELEDRAYSFCLGTQILQNPTQDPRIGTLSFKVSPDMFDVAVSGDTVGTTAIGLATSTNISSVSTWSAAQEIQDDGGTYGVYAVSVAEKQGNGGVVNVAAAGQSIATVVKNRTASGASIAANTFDSTSHGYAAGDAVVIVSGDAPSPLELNRTYYVIPSGANQFLLATSRANAIAGVGNEVDITTSEGPIYLESDDVFEIKRDGDTGSVTVSRNAVNIHTFSSTTLATLRPFFWSRESSNSATIPVFKAIKVSGAS